MWVHCTAHALDLALEDFGKLPFFKDLCRSVRDIVKFINNHQHSRSLFQAKSSLRLLTPGRSWASSSAEVKAYVCAITATARSVSTICTALAGETRFYTEYIAFSRALAVKAHLQETVVSADFVEWAEKQTYKAEAARIKKLILDDDMWTEIELMEKVFRKVVELLQLVDSDMPTLGKVGHALCCAVHLSCLTCMTSHV